MPRLYQRFLAGLFVAAAALFLPERASQRGAEFCHTDRATLHRLSRRQLWTPAHAAWPCLQDRRLHPVRRRRLAVLCAPLRDGADILQPHRPACPTTRSRTTMAPTTISRLIRSACSSPAALAITPAASCSSPIPNIPNAVNVDNVDLRPYTTTFDLFGSELRVGTTINNNPTVQDPVQYDLRLGLPVCRIRAGAVAGSHTDAGRRVRRQLHRLHGLWLV